MFLRKKVKFTLKKLSRIAFPGVPLPEYCRDLADLPVTDMTNEVFVDSPEFKRGVRVLFLTVFDYSKMKTYASHIKNGVVVISGFDVVDEEKNPLPIIKLSDGDAKPNSKAVRAAWDAVGRYLKQEIPMPTIGITGSIGKTTTTRFVEQIFSVRNKVFVTGGNLNHADYIVRQMTRSYDSSYDYHVQEIGGGTMTGVERAAGIVDVDAFCICNIFPHHLNNYKTVDNILWDKASFDRVSNKDIFGVINMDDDMLRSYTFKNRIVTCGVEHTEADYVAINITSTNTELEFDVVHKDVSTHIKIRIPGRHNVYNALFAFALAREFGLSTEEIQQGLLSYESDSMRQGIQVVAGRTLYMDCFNCCIDSIRSGLRTLERMEIPPYGRRIAVLGGENSLAERSEEVNFSAGTELGQYNVDEFIFIGLPPGATAKNIDLHGNAHAVYRGVQSVVHDRSVSFYSNLAQAAKRLKDVTRPGDVIYFKGSFRLRFQSVIDLAFGTAYTYYNPYYTGTSKKVMEQGYTARYFSGLDGCSIIECLNRNTDVVIPDTLDGKRVVRIGKRIFRSRDIRSVDFGNSVITIGENAFSGCTQLEHLVLPVNVVRIEANAFSDCTRLTTVDILHGGHIEKGAFANCKNLRTVTLSHRCITLEDGIFDGCPDVVIRTPAGTYACEYAVKNDLRVEII